VYICRHHLNIPTINRHTEMWFIAAALTMLASNAAAANRIWTFEGKVVGMLPSCTSNTNFCVARCHERDVKLTSCCESGVWIVNNDVTVCDEQCDQIDGFDTDRFPFTPLSLSPPPPSRRWPVADARFPPLPSCLFPSSSSFLPPPSPPPYKGPPVRSSSLGTPTRAVSGRCHRGGGPLVPTKTVHHLFQKCLMD
jgi:hypothetical protein